MSRLSLPVRRYIEDFCSRAFPNRDFSRGSAVGDLVIKASSALFQPLRHEIDITKLGQSVQNYLYLTTDQMDALAANWGYFRQTGAKSFGDVTLYFRQASTYEFNSLTFLSDDGVTFVLTAPVRITAAQLLANVQSDGTYAATVPVVSVGKGSRYSLAAGTINTLQDRPASIVRVTNLSDFAVTAPDESNYDVVNGMFRGLGLKNMVSKQSIRAPLYETFPGILSMVVAGVGHPKMTRDLVAIPGGADIHVGGCVDIWLNTRTLASDTVTISYLPSTGRVRLVSADQASVDEAKFAFSAGAVSAEGRFAPTSDQGTLDESVGVVFDNGGLAYETFVTRATSRGEALLATALKTRGYFIVPPASASSSIVMDLRGPSFASASVAAGDTVSRGDLVQRFSHVGGRAAVLGPVTNAEAGDVSESRLVASAERGDVSIVVATAAGLSPTQRVLISGCPAAGWYRITGVSGETVRIGNLIANGTFNTGTDGSLPTIPGGNSRYRFTAAVQVPAVLDAGMPWVVAGADGLAAPTHRVTAIYRTSTEIYFDVADGGTDPYHAVSVSLVTGLRGNAPVDVEVFYEKDAAAELARSLPTTMSQDNHPTLFSDELVADLSAGATSVPARTNGLCDVQCGDLIHWDLDTTSFTPEQKARAGGSGSVYTSFVDYATDSTITFTPALPVGIPAGTTFSVVRNAPRAYFNATGVGSATLDAVAGANVTLNAFPQGGGTGLGMGLYRVESAANSITAFAAGVATFGATTGLRVGATIQIASDTWRLATYSATPSPAGLLVRLTGTTAPAIGACTVLTPRVVPIAESDLGKTIRLQFTAPRTARVLTFSATSYVSPSPFDINRPVTQTVGGVTAVAVLVSYDSVARTWTVVPNDDAVDTFTAWTGSGEEARVSSGSGIGRITSVSAATTYGYIAPTGGNVGQTVRQGTYTGTLAAITSGFGAPNFTWYVIPTTAGDLFDRLDVPTWVDADGQGDRDAAEPFGFLRAPASEPLFTATAANMVLNETCPWVATSVTTVLSRFGRGGATFSGGKLWANGVASSAFASVTNAAVIFPQGLSAGEYPVTAVGATEPTVTLDVQPEALDVVPAGAAEFTAVFPSAAAITTTAVNLTFPGTNLGNFACDGRVLRLRVGTTTYRLPILAPTAFAADRVRVSYLPVELTGTAAVDVAVVEGFITPYYVVDTAKKYEYRALGAPAIGTNLPLAGDAGALSSNVLTDTTQDFSSVAERSDGLQLFIESSTYASTTPYKVSAQTTNTLTVTGLSVPSPLYDVQYRVDYRPLFAESGVVGTIDGTVVSFPSAHGMSLVRRLGVVINGEVRRITATTTTTITLDSALTAAPAAQTRVVVYPVTADRTAFYSVAGTAFFTYNYYSGNFMRLPVARIASVQELDPDTLSPVRDLEFSLDVVRPGFRYSAREVNDLVISDTTAIGRPLRITYITDSTIAAVDQYVTRDDTAVAGISTLAKRAESFVIDVAITVRSALPAEEVSQRIAQYIETLDTAQRLSKAGIVKALYDAEAASYVNVAEFTMTGLYYQDNGSLTAYDDSPELFGADTACYLAGNIVVTKVDA